MNLNDFKNVATDIEIIMQKIESLKSGIGSRDSDLFAALFDAHNSMSTALELVDEKVGSELMKRLREPR